MKTKSFKNSLKYCLLAGLTTFATPCTGLAQSLDVDLIAYEASQRDASGSVDADIFEAMRALEEVGALIEPEAEPEQINIDAILMAAAPSASAQQPDALSALAKVETKKVDVDESRKQEKSTKPASTTEKVDANAKTVAENSAVAAAPKTTTAQPKIAQPSAVAPTKADIPTKESVGAKGETKVVSQTKPAGESSKPTVAQNTAKTDTAKPTSAAPADTKKYDVVTAKVPTTQQNAATNKETSGSVAKASPKPQSQPVVVASAQNKGVTETASNVAQKNTKTVADASKNIPSSAPSKPQQASTVQASADVATTAVPTSAKNHNNSNDAKSAASPSVRSMQYVAAVYGVNKIDLPKLFNGKMPTISELYQHAFKNKLVYQSSKPAVGDLAFFHNTYDRNQDGRWNDWHTQVGIVESIDGDSTISILVWQDDKIQRIRMNLKYPEIHKGKKGQILNTQLRANDNAQIGLSSKLFGGFANLLGDVKQVTVIDNWQPGMKIGK